MASWREVSLSLRLTVQEVLFENAGVCQPSMIIGNMIVPNPPRPTEYGTTRHQTL